MIAVLELSRAAAARAELLSSGAAGRPVVTLGFFDGLHLGHQRILADLKAWAGEVGGLPAVVTFDRHPQEVLQGKPPISVTSLKQRLLLLARSGVELTLVLRFDREMASWSPEEFVARVVHEAMGSRELLLGFDSALGRRRLGTYDYLKAREAELGLTVRRSEPLFLGEARVSSTLVREAALAGDLRRLRDLLGRPFSVLGEVVRGDQRGRQLGFPTANLRTLPGERLPPSGVYFADAAPLELPVDLWPMARISPDLGKMSAAVVNIGRRPTFTPSEPERLVEAHLLDFSGDLYGRHLEVHLLERCREEKRFSGPGELVAQIRRDVEARRAYRSP
jgi:riboflavin kinase/FMN adenylyltransferase